MTELVFPAEEVVCPENQDLVQIRGRPRFHELPSRKRLQISSKTCRIRNLHLCFRPARYILLLETDVKSSGLPFVFSVLYA